MGMKTHKGRDLAESKQLTGAEPEGSGLPASTVTVGYSRDTGVKEGREREWRKGRREGRRDGGTEGRPGKVELEELFPRGILTENS